jgi:hypothetical protein
VTVEGRKTRRDHNGLHLAHRILPASKNRMRDDGVTDIELLDTVQRRNGLDVLVMQTVTGIDLETKRATHRETRDDAVKFGTAYELVMGFGIGARVKFDHRRTARVGRTDLRFIRIDKERHAYACARQLATCRGHRFEMAGHIKATLGRQLLALFGHETDILRAHLTGDIEHLGGHRAFEVHLRAQLTAQGAHVGVADMSAVFAQMERDRIGTRQLGGQCRLDRVGIVGAARIAHGGDVIDIYTQFGMARRR